MEVDTFHMFLNTDISSVIMPVFCIKHFEHWPKQMPLCVHAEGTTMAALILLAELYRRPVHVCHVARKQEVSFMYEFVLPH